MIHQKVFSEAGPVVNEISKFFDQLRERLDRRSDVPPVGQFLVDDNRSGEGIHLCSTNATRVGT